MRDPLDITPEDIRTEREKIQRELLRRGGMSSHVFFLERILGYPRFDQVHQDLAVFLEDVKKNSKRGLILIPRGHLKSTEVTVGYSIREIIKNPDIRILISNASLDNAKGFLREIKMHFEKGDVLRDVYGDFTNLDDKWSESQIIVSKRKKVLKEPTVQATSIDKSVVSQHYDLIIGDDLVNREWINTKEQRQKLALYLKDLLDLLEPDGVLLLVGTRWHHSDLYGTLLRDNPELWSLFLRTCWADEEKTIPLFKKFTADHLRQLRKEKGPYEFSCQYENSPTDDETADFRPEWIRRFEMHELDNVQTNIFVTIDPAFTTGDLNDYTGIVVNAVTGDDRWHIMKAYRARLNPTALVEELFSLKRMYGSRLRGFAMEKTAHTIALTPAIEMLEKEHKMRLDITDVAPLRRKKEDRIRALIPKLEQGGIEFSPYAEDAVEEVLSFPRGVHEDVLDALAYQLDIAHSGGLPKPGQKGPAVQVIKPRFGRRN